MKVLDYLFYRTYSFYKKKKDRMPDLMACIILSLLIFVSIFSLANLVQLVFKLSIGYSKIIIIPLLLLTLWLIERHYRNDSRIAILEERFAEESSGQKRLRGYIFIVYFLVMVLIPIAIGFMRNNLSWNI